MTEDINGDDGYGEDLFGPPDPVVVPGTPEGPDSAAIAELNRLEDREFLNLTDRMLGRTADDLAHPSQDYLDLVGLVELNRNKAFTIPATPAAPAVRAAIDWERVPTEQMARLTDAILSGDHLDPGDPYEAIVAQSIADRETYEEEVSRG